MKTYLIFIIQAFEEKTSDGTLKDSTTVEVIEKNAHAALKKAASLIKKREYRVSNIIEHEVPICSCHKMSS